MLLVKFKILSDLMEGVPFDRDSVPGPGYLGRKGLGFSSY